MTKNLSKRKEVVSMYRITTKKLVTDINEAISLANKATEEGLEVKLVKITKTQIDDQEPTFSEEEVKVEDLEVDKAFEPTEE